MEIFIILSRRQTEALSYKSNGLRDKQIADRMGISKSAVQIHLRAACEKLKARNTTHGVAIAVAKNLIPSPKHPDIAELEHQAFNLGVYEVAKRYEENHIKVKISAEIDGELLDEYRQFLNELITNSMTC